MPSLLVAQTNQPDSNKLLKFEDALSWEQIKSKAIAENKFIFVDCYTTWCGPCKKMDRDIYSQRRVGQMMNDKYISVKVQMDTTSDDNQSIKDWYSTANQMLREYSIEGFPSYLFFSPQGKLVHKDVGYKSLREFIRMTELARDPQKEVYYLEYTDYKQGKKNYPTMMGLALFTKKLIGDIELADTIANDYKEKYLNHLDTSSLFVKDNLNFILNFSPILKSQDAVFQNIYQNSERFDEVMGRQGMSLFMIKDVIFKEMDGNLLENGIAKQKLPRWDEFQASIAKKYSRLDARQLLLEYKINYYKLKFIDWRLWAKYKNEIIRLYPPVPPYGLSVYIDINGHGGAWHAFLNCDDRKVLKKAVKWADLAIKLEPEANVAYLDTKANLLYKLGKRKVALKIQKEVVRLSPNSSNNVGRYNKMLKNEPTWNVKK